MDAEVVYSASRKLSALTNKALRVLEEVLDNKEVADNPRIRTAATVLEICLKWREHAAIDERLQKLEQRMEKKNQWA